MVNYYKVLELPELADWREIQHKYDQLCTSDYSNTDGSRIDHQLVETAYQVLSSPEQRRHYNKRLYLPPPSPPAPEHERLIEHSASQWTGQSDDEDMRDMDVELDVEKEFEQMYRSDRPER
ncbi:MAG: hypothetical protein Q9200_005582 [Gallowayella weberi]